MSTRWTTVKWKTEWLPEAIEDFAALDHTQQIVVMKAVQSRLETNPEQYGEALRADQDTPLLNFRRIRVKGQRIIYSSFPAGTIHAEPLVWVIIVGDRDGEEAYETASQRIIKLRRRLQMESAVVRDLFKKWMEQREHGGE